MSSVLADFRARFTVEGLAVDGPTEGRVLLNETQLVFAAGGDDRETVPLQSVIDVQVDTVPAVFDPLPGTPVTIAYRSGDSRAVALVAADESTVDKFTAVLFKALLNGTAVTIKHPAKVGGRVVDGEFSGGLLSLSSGAVVFDTEEGPISVQLDAVVDFDRESRTINRVDRSVLVISHMDNGEALTTVAATDSNRKLSLLGRYLRRQYQTVIDSLRDLELSEPETETLTTIYSAGDVDVSLTSVLGKEPKTVKRLLHALHRKGLVESDDGGPVLTATGQIVVNAYLERVNA